MKKPPRYRLRRREQKALVRSKALEGDRPGGRAVRVFARDAPERDLPTAAREPGARGRPRYVRFGVLPNAGRVLVDPVLALSGYVRHRLHGARDKDRIAGVCRVIDPKTGAVVQLLDPITRKPIPPPSPADAPVTRLRFLTPPVLRDGETLTVTWRQAEAPEAP